MICRRFRKRLVLALLVVAWLLSAGWLTAPLLALAQRTSEPATPLHFGDRTAIVMLGGGTKYVDGHRLVPYNDVMTRIGRVGQLYAQCKEVPRTCHVIISGGNPQDHEQAEADNYAPYVVAQKVPRGDVILENQSINTYQNARNTAAIVGKRNYDAVILVTSAYQMPRALLDFHRFDIRPQISISNAVYPFYGVLPRFHNIQASETSLHELIGCAQFYVYRWLGWF